MLLFILLHVVKISLKNWKYGFLLQPPLKLLPLPASLDRHEVLLQWTCSKQASLSITSSCTFFLQQALSLSSSIVYLWFLGSSEHGAYSSKCTGEKSGHSECFNSHESVWKGRALKRVCSVRCGQKKNLRHGLKWKAAEQMVPQLVRFHPPFADLPLLPNIVYA